MKHWLHHSLYQTHSVLWTEHSLGNRTFRQTTKKTFLNNILDTEMRRNMPNWVTDSSTIKLKNWYAVKRICLIGYSICCSGTAASWACLWFSSSRAPCHFIWMAGRQLRWPPNHNVKCHSYYQHGLRIDLLNHFQSHTIHG